jgi:hypothetical protein
MVKMNVQLTWVRGELQQDSKGLVPERWSIIDEPSQGCISDLFAIRAAT